jgi:hypothetical protein
MKRERIKIKETETSESFYVRERDRIIRELVDRKARSKLKREQKREQRRLDRLKIEATSAADSYVTRLMNEAAAAQRLANDARAYQAQCWAKLSQYLLDGTRDDGKKPRIRIVEHDDAPARGQQGAR